MSTGRVLSNTHRPPNTSLRTHAASLALSTNQHGLTGASPEPTSLQLRFLDRHCVFLPSDMTAVRESSMTTRRRDAVATDRRPCDLGHLCRRSTRCHSFQLAGASATTAVAW